MAKPKENTYVLTVTVRNTGKRDARILAAYLKNIIELGSFLPLSQQMRAKFMQVDISTCHVKDML